MQMKAKQKLQIDSWRKLWKPWIILHAFITSKPPNVEQTTVYIDNVLFFFCWRVDAQQQ